MSDYFPPADPDARWATVSPAEASWDAAALEELLRFCEGCNTSQLLILHRGRILAEGYWQGADSKTHFDVASVQKSVVSFVVGQLVAQEVLDLDAPMSSWLGEGWSEASPAQEQQILLRHPLSMTSGLFDDFAYEAPPGTVWYYNNNAYHQVRKAIECATSRSSQALFAEWVFEPIGMTRSEWRERKKMLDPSGWALSGLHSSARDMARFGLLALTRGSWEGRSLGCDPTYFEACLTAATELNPSYGMLWWLFGGERALVPGVRRRDEWNARKSFGGIAIDGRLAPSAPLDAVAGMGAGDQRLYVVPSQDLVVVRHGNAAHEMAAAAGRFDEELWRRLRAAMPAC